VGAIIRVLALSDAFRIYYSVTGDSADFSLPFPWAFQPSRGRNSFPTLVPYWRPTRQQLSATVGLDHRCCRRHLDNDANNSLAAYVRSRTAEKNVLGY